MVPTPPLGMETSGRSHRHTGSRGCRQLRQGRLAGRRNWRHYRWCVITVSLAARNESRVWLESLSLRAGGRSEVNEFFGDVTPTILRRGTRCRLTFSSAGGQLAAGCPTSRGFRGVGGRLTLNDLVRFYSKMREGVEPVFTATRWSSASARRACGRSQSASPR